MVASASQEFEIASPRIVTKLLYKCLPRWFKTLKEIKGFDENFPNGFGVDIDLSYRASKLGIIARMNYWVDHHQMNARLHDNDENAEEMKKASSKFILAIMPSLLAL